MHSTTTTKGNTMTTTEFVYDKIDRFEAQACDPICVMDAQALRKVLEINGMNPDQMWNFMSSHYSSYIAYEHTDFVHSMEFVIFLPSGRRMELRYTFGSDSPVNTPGTSYTIEDVLAYARAVQGIIEYIKVR